jgi:cold shock protein
MRTTVKWFNPSKGYGFLENGTGPDIYVNAKSLRGMDKISVGDIVEFECHVFEGKLVARHVHPVRKQQREQFNRIQQPHFVMQ